MQFNFCSLRTAAATFRTLEGLFEGTELYFDSPSTPVDFTGLDIRECLFVQDTLMCMARPLVPFLGFPSCRGQVRRIVVRSAAFETPRLSSRPSPTPTRALRATSLHHIPPSSGAGTPQQRRGESGFSKYSNVLLRAQFATHAAHAPHSIRKESFTALRRHRFYCRLTSQRPSKIQPWTSARTPVAFLFNRRPNGPRAVRQRPEAKRTCGPSKFPAVQQCAHAGGISV